MKIRILLADDHELFRRGIKRILEEREEIQVIGEAVDGIEAIEKAKELVPDIILMDIAMPNISGLQATKEIKNTHKKIKIIILSMYGDNIDYVRAGIIAGANSVLSKNIIDSELMNAIRECNIDNYYFSPQTLKELIKDYVTSISGETSNKNKNVELNYREIQILNLMGEGLTSNEIAKKLDLNRKTIEFYRRTTMHKLDIKSQMELIKYAIDNNNSLIPKE